MLDHVEIYENICEAITTSETKQRKISKDLELESVVKYFYSNAQILEKFANLCRMLDLDANIVLGLKEQKNKQ